MVTAAPDESFATPGELCRACGAEGLRPTLHGTDRLYRTPGRFAVVVCPACGTGTTLPAASDEELAGYYPSGYVAYQDSGSNSLLHHVSAAIRRWQSWIALQTPPLSLFRTAGPGHALDVGCGRGDLGAALVERGWRVTGIEPSSAACEQARSRGVDARCGTVNTVDLERGKYDVAVFRHSLEHVSDPVQDLALVRSALRPGGYVVVSVPDFDSWCRRAFGDRWFHLELPRHRIHFSRPGLERALARAGFRAERVTKSTSTVGLPASIQYAIFGRCLFPHGLPFRMAATACVAVFPLTWLVDRVLNDGDGLHVVARSLE